MALIQYYKSAFIIYLVNSLVLKNKLNLELIIIIQYQTYKQFLIITLIIN